MTGPIQESSGSSNAEEMDVASLNESPLKMESEPEVEPPFSHYTAIQDLKTKRELIQHLLDNTTVAEGDYWFLIPRTYLDGFLSHSIDDFDEMKSYLGPLNTNLILDPSGTLYPEDNEPTPSTSVPKEVFKHLVDWFGLQGEPISRALMIDASGNTSIERFPPYFVLHGLTRTAPKSSYNSSNNARPSGIFVSQTKTFENVLETIRASYIKNSKTAEFRVWFIDCERVEELNANITINSFVNDIAVKTIVFKGIYNYSLKSQKITGQRYHLLIEPYDKSAKQFLLDAYLDGIDYSKFELENVITSGGDIGLINLGNTCYMNSALQCLLHIPEINNYFFFKIFEKELNKSNPLGYGGNMAIAFGSLLTKLFNTSSTQQSSLSPREFKYTIGHYSSMFHGYQQQDSQEFLSWLLDALHEDLNRIYHKPYIEKPELDDDEISDDAAIQRLADTCWNQYKQRNDSAIIDLFSGLYQSTLVCPDCSKTSITFDPFNDLTLPLPVNTKWYHRFKVINLDFNIPADERIKLFEVELNKTSTLSDLVAYLSDFMNVPSQFVFLFEIFNSFFYRDFQGNNTKYKFFPISELINKNDEVLVYIIPHNPETDVIVPVFNTYPDPDKSYNISNVFGVPLFVVIDKKETRSFGKIRGKLEQLAQVLTKVDLGAHYRTLKKLEVKKYYDGSNFPDLKEEWLSNKRIEEEEAGTETHEFKSNESEDDYDSDISLADPEVSGSYGFTIKYWEDNKYGNRERLLNIPFTKPNFSTMAKLSDNLPALKRNFYHYADYVSNKRAKFHEKKTQRDDDYVFVNNKTASGGQNNEASEDSNSQSDALSKSDDVSDEDEEDEVDTNDPDDNLYEDDTASDEIKIGALFDSMSDLPSKKDVAADPQEPQDKHPVFVTSSSVLVCEWDNDVYEQIFDDIHQAWKQISEIPNPELERNKKELMKRQRSTVSLYDCLKVFNQPEILGDQDLWYCPRCKDHKQATKTIEIWSTGDILTIHLKRFQVARSFSDKIDMTVEFPIEGLDITDYTKSKADGRLIYDLIAVDNHYGGLGGGHYTASVKNFRDGKWYYYNDGRVTLIENPEETVTGAAYLLFYRKRTTDEFLGGEQFNQLLKQGREQMQENLIKSKENVVAIDQQVKIWMQHEASQVEDTEISTPSNKKSRSPMEEESALDKKKRLLSKDKAEIDSPGVSSSDDGTTDEAS